MGVQLRTNISMLVWRIVDVVGRYESAGWIGLAALIGLPRVYIGESIDRSVMREMHHACHPTDVED